MQQTNPSAIQATINEALNDVNINVVRDFIVDLTSLNRSVTLQIRRLMLWRAIRRESSAWLALLTSWTACRALNNLGRLDLFDCSLGPASAAILAPFLQRAYTLRELHLDHNPELADQNAYEVLIPALGQTRNLTTLSLTYCLLPAAASMALGEVIEGALSLEELDLEGNRLEDGGSRHLAQSILHSPPEARLHFLNLSDNQLQGAVPVQQALLAAGRTRHVIIAIHDVFRFDLVKKPNLET